MEKTEVTTRTIEEATHHFYCDNCNEYLGESHEHEDGWYQKLGEFELKIYMSDGWYSVKKCLCDNCKDEYFKKVKNTLLELGFNRREQYGIDKK